jgi:hypothetical protein
LFLCTAELNWTEPNLNLNHIFFFNPNMTFHSNAWFWMENIFIFKLLKFRKLIWGSHCGDYGDYCHLRYHTT